MSEKEILEKAKSIILKYRRPVLVTNINETAKAIYTEVKNYCKKHPKGCKMSYLQTKTNMSRNTLNEYLILLREAGFIYKSRIKTSYGATVHYTASKETIEEVKASKMYIDPEITALIKSIHSIFKKT